MEIYNARAGNISEEEKRKLIFLELQDLHKHTKRKSKKTATKSKLFGWLNVLLNLSIVFSAAAIVVITAINNFQNIPVIILGGVIFAISGSVQLLKLSDRGFYYRQGSSRLRRIIQESQELMYMFQKFVNEEILAYISMWKNEIEEIDLDLYKFSMVGEAKFGNGLRIVENEGSDSRHTPEIDRRYNSAPILSVPSSKLGIKDGNENEDKKEERTDSHIHIHIDSSNSSPNNSNHPSPILPHVNITHERHNTVPIFDNKKVFTRTQSAPMPTIKKEKEIDEVVI